MGLDRDVFAEGEVSDGVLGACAVILAFLRTVDAAEADGFSALVVEDFDGVTVEDGNDWAGKVRINYKLGR